MNITDSVKNINEFFDKLAYNRIAKKAQTINLRSPEAFARAFDAYFNLGSSKLFSQRGILCIKNYFFAFLARES